MPARDFGYIENSDDNATPLTVTDAPVPPYTPSAHNPPGTVYGYKEGYPTAAGYVYTGGEKK
jgi:hypothetical protein